MRSRLVRKGFNLLTAGVVVTTLATFYPAMVSDLVPFSAGPASVIYFGFFWGSMLGGAGTIITVFGMLRAEERGRAVGLRTPILVLMATLLAFTILVYLSLNGVPMKQPPLKPGETITI